MNYRFLENKTKKYWCGFLLASTFRQPSSQWTEEIKKVVARIHSKQSLLKRPVVFVEREFSSRLGSLRRTRPFLMFHRICTSLRQKQSEETISFSLKKVAETLLIFLFIQFANKAPKAEKNQKKNNVRNHKIFEKSKSLTMESESFRSGGSFILP